jgi:hypothetical protein
MKGYKFYLEFPSTKAKRKSGKANAGHSGNCLALATERDFTYISNGGIMTEGLMAVFFTPDSPVCWSSVSWGFLKEKCKRVSEATAREIHPALFQRLDD